MVEPRTSAAKTLAYARRDIAPGVQSKPQIPIAYPYPQPAQAHRALIFSPQAESIRGKYVRASDVTADEQREMPGKPAQRTRAWTRLLARIAEPTIARERVKERSKDRNGQSSGCDGNSTYVFGNTDRTTVLAKLYRNGTDEVVAALQKMWEQYRVNQYMDDGRLRQRILRDHENRHATSELNAKLGAVIMRNWTFSVFASIGIWTGIGLGSNAIQNGMQNQSTLHLICGLTYMAAAVALTTPIVKRGMESMYKFMRKGWKAEIGVEGAAVGLLIGLVAQVKWMYENRSPFFPPGSELRIGGGMVIGALLGLVAGAVLDLIDKNRDAINCWIRTKIKRQEPNKPTTPATE